MKIEFEIYREIFKWKKTFDPELYILLQPVQQQPV